MRSLYLLLLFACLIWTASIQAQMFASIQECDARYGKAVSPTDLTSDVRFYQQDGLTIKILFTDGKAAVVTYTSSANGKIKEDAQQKLLETSAAGNRWEKIEGEGSTTWQRSDGLAFAIYDSTSGELTLLSTDYMEKAKSESQATASHP